MELTVVKPSDEQIIQFSKETAVAMMHAMGQAKGAGILKTDEDMLDLIAVGLAEAFKEFIEIIEKPNSKDDIIV